MEDIPSSFFTPNSKAKRVGKEGSNRNTQPGLGVPIIRGDEYLISELNARCVAENYKLSK